MTNKTTTKHKFIYKSKEIINKILQTTSGHVFVDEPTTIQARVFTGAGFHTIQVFRNRKTFEIIGLDRFCNEVSKLLMSTDNKTDEILEESLWKCLEK